MRRERARTGRGWWRDESDGQRSKEQAVEAEVEEVLHCKDQRFSSTANAMGGGTAGTPR